MIIRVARSVLHAMQVQVDWYATRAGLPKAQEISDNLYEGLTQVGTHYTSAVAGLPDNYRRQKADPCYLFYLREDNIAYVYLLRGLRQRPLRPQYHKALATKAKRDNVGLN